MSERRHEAAPLLEILTRHRERAEQIAEALLELERHPGYRLLEAGHLEGSTARRWDRTLETRESLWRDHARWSDVLRTAERHAARPDVAELDRLLGGDPDRPDGPDALAARVTSAIEEIRALAQACAALRSSVLAALVPAAERLAGARRAVAELGFAPDDPDAVAAAELTVRSAELEHRATTDPLAFSGTSVEGALAGLTGPVAELCSRLDVLTGLRNGWADVLGGLDDDLAGLGGRYAGVAELRGRIRDELRDVVPSLPPDRRPELDGLRAAVDRADGWQARRDAVDALRARVAAARAELDTTRTLAEGLLERRDDLRGRFRAYRARTHRLGHAGDPELTELDGRIGDRLWTVPSELARATRDLAAYRRRLAVLSGS